MQDNVSFLYFAISWVLMRRVRGQHYRWQCCPVSVRTRGHDVRFPGPRRRESVSANASTVRGLSWTDPPCLYDQERPLVAHTGFLRHVWHPFRRNLVQTLFLVSACQRACRQLDYNHLQVALSIFSLSKYVRRCGHGRALQECMRRKEEWLPLQGHSAHEVWHHNPVISSNANSTINAGSEGLKGQRRQMKKLKPRVRHEIPRVTGVARDAKSIQTWRPRARLMGRVRMCEGKH